MANPFYNEVEVSGSTDRASEFFNKLIDSNIGIDICYEEGDNNISFYTKGDIALDFVVETSKEFQELEFSFTYSDDIQYCGFYKIYNGEITEELEETLISNEAIEYFGKEYVADRLRFNILLSHLEDKVWSFISDYQSSYTLIEEKHIKETLNQITEQLENSECQETIEDLIEENLPTDFKILADRYNLDIEEVERLDSLAIELNVDIEDLCQHSNKSAIDYI